ncbi:hypothetical protein NEIRO03_1172 [Nematocida sp. AWRm78]|nr:hypothetical protein NEIRO02_1242 [Nematocida sp. AWRm79]KAI5183590.1 hypothetical protein NEIRO03_1172 [Nematocida sp. AWRm78]
MEDIDRIPEDLSNKVSINNMHRSSNIQESIPLNNSVVEDITRNSEDAIISVDGESIKQPVHNYLKGKELYFTIISSIIGSGVLFIHSALTNGGILSFIIASILSYIGIVSITESVFRGRKNEIVTDQVVHDKNEVTYVSFANLQPRFLHVLFTVLLVTLMLITTIIYQTLIWEWTYNNIEFLFGDVLSISNQNINIIKGIASLLMIIVLWWYSVIESPGDTKNIQIITNISIVLLSVVLAIFMVIIYTVFKPNIPSTDTLKYLVIGKDPSVLKFFGAVATVFFAINSHYNIPVYMSKVRISTKKSALYPVLISNTLVYILFFIIGMEGYFLVRANEFNGANSNILTSISLVLDSNKHDTDHNTVYIIAQTLISVFKLAMSIILLNSFMWHMFSYRTLTMQFIQRIINNSMVIRIFSIKNSVILNITDFIKKIFTESIPNLFMKIISYLPESISKRFERNSIRTSNKMDESTGNSKVLLRYVVGTVLFSITTLIVMLEIDLNIIIQVTGAVVSSFISILVPSIFIITNRHTHNKRWFDYLTVTFMIIGFITLISIGIIKAYYSIEIKEVSVSNILNTTESVLNP